MFKKILHNKMALIGIIIVAIVFIIGLFSSTIASYDPNLRWILYNVASPANQDHVWGTDELGRDIFSRVVTGAKTSLFIAVTVVGIGTVLGTLIGAVSGYLGGAVDNVTMKIMDTIDGFSNNTIGIVLCHNIWFV